MFRSLLTRVRTRFARSATMELEVVDDLNGLWEDVPIVGVAAPARAVPPPLPAAARPVVVRSALSPTTPPPLPREADNEWVALVASALNRSPKPTVTARAHATSESVAAPPALVVSSFEPALQPVKRADEEDWDLLIARSKARAAAEAEAARPQLRLVSSVAAVAVSDPPARAAEAHRAPFSGPADEVEDWETLIAEAKARAAV